MISKNPQASSTTASTASYRQFRAPKQDGATLVEPAWEVLNQLARKRDEQLPLLDPARMQSARRSLVELAREWTGTYAQLPNDLASKVANDSTPIILSGHQPQLFHPGVWFKNFSLSRLAKAVDGIGIHLLIDSDLCRDVAIRVPTGTTAQPRSVLVSYDQSQPTMPFEERHVVDRDQLDSFAERVEGILGTILSGTMLTSLWSLVGESADRGHTLGEAISEGRHRIELAHGNVTLEVPFSKVCDTEPFRYFLLEILRRAEEFQQAYNGALGRYRTSHKLRNAAQPLPNLSQSEDWIETPFWVWSSDNPQRRPLWCRTSGEKLILADLADELVAESLSIENGPAIRWQTTLDGAQPEVAIEQLQTLRAAGIKIRSRALATTLYCRHFLADLFLHGIGGAKYDQVTDDLSQQFFGFAPPSHATLTATVRLFTEHPDEPTLADLRQLELQLRSYRYHPERYLDDGRTLTVVQQQAIAEKRRWVQTEKTPANAAERHQAIEQANRLLYDSLEAERLHTTQELESLTEQLRLAPFYTSREYAFCLFPERALIERLQTLVAGE